MEIKEEVVLVFMKVKTMIGTQWKIRCTQRPVHMNVCICGYTFICKIGFLTYSLLSHEISMISFESPCVCLVE